MQYKNVKKGTFIARPNRFIAYVEIDGREEICHVKNTGRCRELLLPGTEVYLEPTANPDRKTKYDLIAVRKGKSLINIDSTAPNAVFGEWVRESGFFGEITLFKPECTYQNSRFDFYLEAAERKIFIEVKGVTLEENGVVRFPDAPTERGIKHLRQLTACLSDGYEAHVFFIAQMEKANYFTPNRQMHAAFADALSEAYKRGVGVHCLSCHIAPDALCINTFVPVKL